MGQKKYTEAIKSYQTALTLQNQLKDSISQARTMNSLGMAYSMLGQTTQAIAQFEAALKLERAQNLRSEIANSLLTERRCLPYLEELRQSQAGLRRSA